MENYEGMNSLGTATEKDADTKTPGVCAHCGAALQEGEKFCPQCWKRVDSEFDQFDSGAANKKKIPIIIGAALAVIVLAVLAFTVIPKIFIGMEGCLEQGNYEKAYEKAKTDYDKMLVKAENAAAIQSAITADNLKDPSSFSLRDVYYSENTLDDGERTKSVVLYIGATNSYGATVSSYWYYLWSSEDNEWQYICHVSDLSEEEFSDYDDDEEKRKKIINSLAKNHIKDMMENDTKLDKSAVKRINKLFEEDKLDDVEFLDVE